MSGKIDRRIQRTRALLRKSILELVLDHGYEDLTIEQITEHVNLGRTTFYLHFRDKKELLIDSLEVEMDQLFKEIYSPKNIEKWTKEGVDPRKLMFIRTAENAVLYKKLFTGELGGLVLGQFHAQLAVQLKTIVEAWQSDFDLDPPIPNTVTSHYTAGALTGLLLWWLENDMSYPPEEMYEMYHYILVHGVVQSSGLDKISSR